MSPLFTHAKCLHYTGVVCTQMHIKLFFYPHALFIYGLVLVSLGIYSAFHHSMANMGWAMQPLKSFKRAVIAVLQLLPFPSLALCMQTCTRYFLQLFNALKSNVEITTISVMCFLKCHNALAQIFNCGLGSCKCSQEAVQSIIHTFTITLWPHMAFNSLQAGANGRTFPCDSRAC